MLAVIDRRNRSRDFYDEVNRNLKKLLRRINSWRKKQKLPSLKEEDILSALEYLRKRSRINIPVDRRMEAILDNIDDGLASLRRDKQKKELEKHKGN